MGNPVYILCCNPINNQIVLHCGKFHEVGHMWKKKHQNILLSSINRMYNTNFSKWKLSRFFLKDKYKNIYISEKNNFIRKYIDMNICYKFLLFIYIYIYQVQNVSPKIFGINLHSRTMIFTCRSSIRFIFLKKHFD